MVPTTTKNIFVQFMTMLEKQILARVLESKNKIEGNHAFLEIIKQQEWNYSKKR